VSAVSLPPLREELGLYPGPSLATGEPSYTLEDPVRNQFFRIDWLTFEILKRWSLGNPRDMLLSIEAGTALRPAQDDVEAVLRFLQENQLVQPDPLTSAAAMAARRRAGVGAWYTRLLHNYLFFRIPLLKPDRWLDRVAPKFEWMFSAMFFRLTLAALLVGGVQVYRKWDQFHATLMDTFTPSGLFAYGVALLGVKCAHELGHALSAKRRGCRVPSMGVAFLVLWPVPYTDTNDVWKLADKRHRRQVASAGVATELLVAVWSTLAWALLPDGILRDIAFPLATTTWIATLAINASPFMRFDGYFVLSDWLDMPNLHTRAFALARWDLRERLFGLGEPPPEYFPRRRHAGLILFAWGVWLYRLALFLGIAVLVYHFFIKLVGILLFAVEITWFVLRPVAAEIGAWRALWPRIRSSRRARLSMLLAGLGLLLFVLPWPTRIASTGTLRPAQVYTVHAPAHAQVAALPLREGARVKEGDALLKLAVTENSSRREALQAEVQRLGWQVAAAGFTPEQRAQSTVLAEQLATAQAQLAALDQEASRFAPTAPFDGVVRDIDPELAPGTWVHRNERLAVLVGAGGAEVATYLDEDDVRRVSIGDAARFYSDGAGGPALRLAVSGIDRDASPTLPDGRWAEQNGGSVPARERRGAWYPERAVYRVTFVVSGSPEELQGRVWRGKVVVSGSWEAPGARVARSLAALLWQEAGF
jgi:putative peptide zinc metalloprotease protein